jgi:integrase
MNEKRDIHEHNRNLVASLARIESWNILPELKKDLKNFINDLGIGKVNLGKKASDRTRCKYIDILKVPLVYFNKPLNKITVKDVEALEKSLSSGRLISQRGKTFNHSTQTSIKVALRIFLKWKLGEGEAFKLAGWLDTRDKKKTPDFLKEIEIEKLYKNCKSTKERFLIAVLFDTGARIEEFLNIRYEDIELPIKEKNFVKITLKEEYSKTKGRTISLYWKNSLEAVNEYLKELEQKGIKSKDVVFDARYDAVRMFVTRLGQKVLKKDVNLHLFRHSSATFYAPKLNRQELCYRYGWTFSSDMPDVYISRSGMLNKDLDEKFESTELSELKTKMVKEEFERKRTQEEVNQLKEIIQKFLTGDLYYNPDQKTFTDVKNKVFKTME